MAVNPSSVTYEPSYHNPQKGRQLDPVAAHREFGATITEAPDLSYE
ncbi:MAG: hypothetical protein SVW77_00130 [Candidatus Nanohaloarchaea archaeon]|nr:hypothetical protein [Candidatus Nanohaloarchaea archaeon]